MIKVDFNDYKDCELVYERYYDGNKRLSLVDPEGFKIAVATVNVETTLNSDVFKVIFMLDMKRLEKEGAI